MFDDFRFNYDFMSNVPRFLQKLESVECQKTSEITLYDEELTEISEAGDFLYHGIRFQENLEKLEKIFIQKRILAGKYIDNYSSYDDNCNMGEYVSLLYWIGMDSAEYKKFIIPNISLIVSPLCDGVLTHYVDFNTWSDIQKAKENHKLELKNLYSYMRGECLVKDEVPLSMVKAIGVPYYYLSINNSIEYAEKKLNDVKNMMDKYNIKLPIVDTSRYNKVLVDIEKEKIDRKSL